MFKKLFGGSKNDFYLELKDEDSSTDAQIETTSNGAKPAPLDVEEKEPKAETPAPETGETIPETSKESGTPRQKTFKKQKGAKKEAVPAKPESTPAPVAAVKPAPKEPEIKTFAPTYLIPTSTKVRRRPGPNMNSFLDMAGQVKIARPKTSK
ncbi:MAG: hypothetical protein HRU34_13735 [Richelia sp.]|nr:hypothetical protein [Richelia sp.]